MIYILVSAFLFFNFGGLVQADEECVTVRTEYGLVCGARKKASNGKEYVSFLGIPYAKAPTGNLRFAEPQRPDPYDGVFNATQQGPICPQNTSRFVGAFMRPTSMSEDCLHLNVYAPLATIPALDLNATMHDLDSNTMTPDLDLNATTELLAVFFFIHGGSFYQGSGDPDAYGPEHLLSKNMVLVTINYRLGPLGFLNLNNKHCPGNAGLRDALFALQWVQKNIASMGGDPTRVTLSGHSAGAAMAHLLALSPATKHKNLFKSVYLLSGTAIANFFTIAKLNGKYMAGRFLEALKISPLQSAAKIHKAICDAPIEAIIKANDYVLSKSTFGIAFVPGIDEQQDGFTQIVPKDPEDLMDDGNDKDYNMMISFTDAECNVYRPVIEIALPALKLVPFLIVPQNLLATSNPLTIPVLTNKISGEYFNYLPPTVDKFIYLCTDSFYKYPAFRSVDKRIAVNAKPTYVYQFSYDFEGENALELALGYSWSNVAHSQDLDTIFRINSIHPPTDENELAQNTTVSVVRKYMTDTIGNFVETGQPGDENSGWLPMNVSYKIVDVTLPAPPAYQYQPPTAYMTQKNTFFNNLYKIGRFRLFGK